MIDLAATPAETVVGGVDDSIWDMAHRLADAARPVTLAAFRGALTVERKGTAGFDPVTQADRATEKTLREIIRAERPDDGILGEEEAALPSNSGWTWVLDPIDGTRGYMSGTPTWGVLIALSDATGPKLGIIDQPYIGERFCGGFGTASFTGPHDTRPLSTKSTTTLDEAIIFTTFPEVGTKAEGAAFHDLAGRCMLTRYGMDCYAYGLLALGQIDLVVEAGLAPYDIHAPIAVVQAAGGIITDWQGGPAHGGGRVIAAATPELHARALTILSTASLA